MKMNKTNRFLLICLILFFCFTLIGTYVARCVYLNKLAYVRIVEVSQGHLQKTYEMEAAVVAESGEYKRVYAPADLKITAIIAESGDKLNLGDEVIRFDTEELELALIRLQLQQYDLSDEKDRLEEALGNAEMDEDRSKIEKMIRQNEILSARLSRNIGVIEQWLAGEGVVTAVNCDVAYILPAGTQTVSDGQLLYTYNPFPCAKVLEFALSKDEKRLATGTTVICELAVLNANMNQIETRSFKLPITQRKETDSGWLYRISLDVEQLYMHAGDTASITVSYVSGSEYKNVLPRECVKFTADQNGYIHVLRERERGFGTEYYVESMYVQILDMDDERVALAADPGAPVVLTTDTLSEGTAVRLW
jgi:hypothetical protein